MPAVQIIELSVVTVLLIVFLRSILFMARTSATTIKNENSNLYIQRHDVTRHAQTGLSAGGNT